MRIYLAVDAELILNLDKCVLYRAKVLQNIQYDQIGWFASDNSRH